MWQYGSVHICLCMCAVCACVCFECVCLYLHTVKVQTLSTVGQNNKFRILGCEANSVPRVFLFILDFRKKKKTKQKKEDELPCFSSFPRRLCSKKQFLVSTEETVTIRSYITISMASDIEGFSNHFSRADLKVQAESRHCPGCPLYMSLFKFAALFGGLLPPFLWVCK